MKGKKRFFAFLRAINIGGRRMTNEELKEPFTSLGLDDVDAYQAAGNLTFRAGETEGALVAAVESQLSSKFGFDVPVFLRSEGELRDAMRLQHFAPEQLSLTQGRVQVSFLRAPPEAEDVRAALALVPDEDLVVFEKREWFWLPKTGVSESALPVGSVEKLVGPMTMRTVGTVERMLRRFGEAR